MEIFKNLNCLIGLINNINLILPIKYFLTFATPFDLNYNFVNN